MALSQKHRSSIYQSLTPIIGEEEAEALLSQFPSRELDEPVTKEFVRAEIAQVRGELHTGLAELRAEMAELRGDLHTEVAGLRAEFHDRLREMTIWLAGAMTLGMGVAAGIGRLAG